MANTYTQVHVQYVFAVKYRLALIHPSWKDELYKYMTGIVQNYNHKLLAINGVKDHVHLLVGMRPTQSMADLMKHVKGDSSEWINKKGLPKYRLNGRMAMGHFLIQRIVFLT